FLALRGLTTKADQLALVVLPLVVLGVGVDLAGQLVVDQTLVVALLDERVQASQLSPDNSADLCGGRCRGRHKGVRVSRVHPPRDDRGLQMRLTGTVAGFDGNVLGGLQVCRDRYLL